MQKENIDIIISVIAASLFLLLLVFVTFLLFRIYLKRKNKLLLEKELMKIEFEKTLLRTQLEIQEQTFTNVSREIHDNISQVLSLVRLNLNTLETTKDQVKVNMMDELMEKAMQDLRSLSHSLDTDDIRTNGWTKAVQKLLKNLERSGKYTVHISTDHDLPALGNDKPIILFRMIQETINNIIKHAKADTIHFDAGREKDGLSISIRDNGRGFVPDATANGVGLRNLAARCKMIAGQMSISSTPGNGTLVTIFVKAEIND
jgi:signal transduction histidine kinase